MKKALFVIIMAIFATAFSASAQDVQKITFDYSRSFIPHIVHLDFNGDSECQDGEGFKNNENTDAIFTVKHSDFGSAGNIHVAELSVRFKDGTGFRGKARLTDITFIRGKRSDNQNKELFAVMDNFGDDIYFISHDKDTGEVFILINNPAFFEFDTF